MTELMHLDEQLEFCIIDDAATVSALVRRMPRERLAERHFGEWAAIDLNAHVTHLAEVNARRLERCRREEMPTLESVPSGELAPHGPHGATELARRFHVAQSAIARMLAEGVTSRRARHSEWGEVTAEHLAAYHAKHCHEHVRELAAAFPPG